MGIHGLNSNQFADLAKSALADEVQKGAIGNATDTIRERRGAAVDQVGDWEDLRERARAIKAHTLAKLDHYLLQFVDNAESRGIVVHWADDADQACQIIAELIDETCEAGGPNDDLRQRPIVKAKSMVTEEIGLNHLLEERGLRPVETDLGEWIQQLAGEPPSHIIVPAIHKTQQQIADLFAEQVGSDSNASAEELTAIARRILRSEFANAAVGVSGVNFAVAETGSFLVLENEGNIRLTTSLPQTHIAVMGIEKLLPRLSDLDVFLRLLPRSGTGQQLTTYQSLITGLSNRSALDGNGSDESSAAVNGHGEGPTEVHVVLVDHGRSDMLQDELRRSSLQCIRCGACLNVCPVYRQIGGHAYGSVYPGPIGSVLTPQLAGIEEATPLPFASSLCGACGDVCPVKIDLPELLLDLRKEAQEAGGSKIEKLGFGGWAWMMNSQWRYGLTIKMSRMMFPIGTRLAPFKKWGEGREFPKPAKRSFREQWRAKS
jgi:L-lactate dehydrogenase complex protein LldF